MNLTADDLLAMRAGEMNTGLGGLASNLIGEREREKGEDCKLTDNSLARVLVLI